MKKPETVYRSSPAQLANLEKGKFKKGQVTNPTGRTSKTELKSDYITNACKELGKDFTELSYEDRTNLMMKACLHAKDYNGLERLQNEHRKYADPVKAAVTQTNIQADPIEMMLSDESEVENGAEQTQTQTKH